MDDTLNEACFANINVDNRQETVNAERYIKLFHTLNGRLKSISQTSRYLCECVCVRVAVYDATIHIIINITFISFIILCQQLIHTAHFLSVNSLYPFNYENTPNLLHLHYTLFSRRFYPK